MDNLRQPGRPATSVITLRRRAYVIVATFCSISEHPNYQYPARISYKKPSSRHACIVVAKGTEIHVERTRRRVEDGARCRGRRTPHREDGPAIRAPNQARAWMRHGVLFREDGPALEFSNGAKVWYRDGSLVEREHRGMSKIDDDVTSMW